MAYFVQKIKLNNQTKELSVKKMEQNLSHQGSSVKEEITTKSIL